MLCEYHYTKDGQPKCFEIDYGDLPGPDVPKLGQSWPCPIRLREAQNISFVFREIKNGVGVLTEMTKRERLSQEIDALNDECVYRTAELNQIREKLRSLRAELKKEP